jgi:hypothetical protein
VSNQNFLSVYSHIQGLYAANLIEECRQKFHSVPNYLYRVLCDPNPSLEVVRNELDELIGFAKRCGLLDQETAGRLRSFDDAQFLAALSELQAGRFFSDRGFVLRPRPDGRAGKKGDFEILASPPIFTEVKAIFDRPREVLYHRLTTKLWECARRALRGVHGGLVIDFERMTAARDFRGAGFMQQLRSAALSVLDSGESVSVAYRDASGFAVDVAISPWPGSNGRPFMMGPVIVGAVATQDQVLGAIDSALPQMPDDGRRNLAIIHPHLTFPPDAEDLDTAVGHVFGRRTNRRLSAVGLLVANVQRTGTTLSLSVHLNPAARYPLRAEELEAEGVVVPRHD